MIQVRHERRSNSGHGWEPPRSSSWKVTLRRTATSSRSKSTSKVGLSALEQLKQIKLVGTGKIVGALATGAVPINQYREQAVRGVTSGHFVAISCGQMTAPWQVRTIFEPVLRADYIIIRSAICEQQVEAVPLSILDQVGNESRC